MLLQAFKYFLTCIFDFPKNVIYIFLVTTNILLCSVTSTIQKNHYYYFLKFVSRNCLNHVNFYFALFYILIKTSFFLFIYSFELLYCKIKNCLDWLSGLLGMSLFLLHLSETFPISWAKLQPQFSHLASFEWRYWGEPWAKDGTF